MKKIAIPAPDWFKRGSMYQINPRNFSKEGTLNSITKELEFLRDTGFSIIYLCPIFSEDDSTDTAYWSKRQIASNTGNPKNMYRINDYFNIDEEFGTLEDLKALVDKAHSLNLRVVLDLVYDHIGPNAPIIKKHPEFVKQKPDGSFIYTPWNFPALDFNCEGLREYLYCNMVYYVGVIGVDGFRCDVGDDVPIDFWNEAKKRITAIKQDAVLINEGSKFYYMLTAFESCYCFVWHEVLRKIFCEGEPANKLRASHVDLLAQIPQNALMLRDIDNHDTVTDWIGRTETLATHDGMEQIKVINYLIDGVPMSFCGNELACEAKLSMFANRFYMGDFEVCDRTNKNSSESVRRQSVLKTLNGLKKKSDILCFGNTQWLDVSIPESVIAFKRVLDTEEIIFISNATNKPVTVEIPNVCEETDCILTNGSVKREKDTFSLSAYEYIVLKK